MTNTNRILTTVILVALTTSCIQKKETVKNKELMAASISEQREILATNTKNRHYQIIMTVFLDLNKCYRRSRQLIIRSLPR